MMEEIRNIKSGKSDLRKFGITIGIILLAIAGYFFWQENEIFKLFIAIGTILLTFGIVYPKILKPVYWVWMIFAAILGWFMTRVILSLLFYLVFTPLGSILRLFGKQFLELKWDKTKNSYWNYRTLESTGKKNYENQF